MLPPGFPPPGFRPPALDGRFPTTGSPRGHLQTGRRQASGLTGQPADRPVLARPGSDLLSHALRRSTIGAEGLHGRVRDGIGCFPLAITTRPCKHRTAPEGSPAGSRNRPPVFVRVRTRTILPRKRQTGSWRDRAHRGPAPRKDRGRSPDDAWKADLRRRPPIGSSGRRTHRRRSVFRCM